MSVTFNDHFSGHAADYAQNRPRYTAAVAAYCRSLAPDAALAWDVATGNGQLAVELAGLFDSVIATDASAAQLANATAHPRIDYRCEPAEKSTLPTHSVSLITVAQAAHWFDARAFADEVRRVGKPGAAIVYTAYDLLACDPAVDAVLRWYYRDVVGPYWPPERAHFDDHYRSVPFPFAEVAAPSLTLHATWSRERLLAYIDTWSATQRYRAQHAGQTDPLAILLTRLEAAWPAPAPGPAQGDRGARALTWPLLVRAGHVV